MLNTEDVSELSAPGNGPPLSVWLLCEWVVRGYLRPAVYGRPGGGSRGHLWSGQQLLGLAIGAVLYRSPRAAAPQYIGRVTAHFAGLSRA